MNETPNENMLWRKNNYLIKSTLKLKILSVFHLINVDNELFQAKILCIL